MPELKPCPFCGGEAKLYDLLQDDGKKTWYDYYIECTVCHSRTDDGEKMEVIKTWNTRMFEDSLLTRDDIE